MNVRLLSSAPRVLTAVLAIALAPAAAVPQTALDDGLPIARQLSAAFERVAERVSPAVVSIDALRRVDDDSRGFSFGGSSPRLQQGQGSGFIISDDGTIVTNHHVVRDASEVSVRLDDGRRFDAQVLGTDPRMDLALLRIDADDLDPVELGTSDDLRVGQWVVAAGSPYGLTSTITTGIVSATGRSRVGIADYENFIQTDAAINPGNSGGPLVDLDGRVIGINTAIFSRYGGSMGIGFAIPIDMARPVLETLRREGRVVRGWLGVMILDVAAASGDVAAAGFDGDRGVFVRDVVRDGPSAGRLRAGDILVAYEGQPVDDVLDLQLHVASTRPGTDAAVRVYREGRLVDVPIEVGVLPGDEAEAAPPLAAADGEMWGWHLEDLTPDVAARLGLPRGSEGALVVGVDADGPADRAGIAPGEVIVQVDGEPVTNVRDLDAVLAGVDREDGVRFVLRGPEGARFEVMRPAF